jgi:hypothetical protein
LEDAGFEDFNQQEKEPTMSVEKHLNNSVESLRTAIRLLEEKAAAFYSEDDNYRGNIHFDAASRLRGDLDRLIIGRDYITLAIKK